MRTFYKAARPDGTDFHTGTVNYGRALTTGEVLHHPTMSRPTAEHDVVKDPAHYFSVSTVPTDCTGMSWMPGGGCRLFEVEPLGDLLGHPDARGLPNKRTCLSLRVVRELPAHEVFGPQGQHVVQLFDRIKSCTFSQSSSLAAAWDAARDAAWDAARDAAWDAARALLLRDLIGTGGWTQEHYNTLTGTWVSVMGKVHPDDEDPS